jgi:hypothetical protein
MFTLLMLCLVAVPLFALAGPTSPMAEPGLPFTEDFDDTLLQDATHTDAYWSTGEGALLLPSAVPLTGTLDASTVGSQISTDVDPTRAVLLGDMDGDGDLDLVVANCIAPNKLYLNNGSAAPFDAVTGIPITPDEDTTKAIALGDVDGDSDLDLIAANGEITTTLYLNNGTVDPFAGVIGRKVAHDSPYTKAISLADMDGDGDLDLVVANKDQINKLYLNNGSSEPFHDIQGIDIGSETDPTYSIALGDLDGDGDVDLVAGNGTDDGTGFINKYYLNTGSPILPFDPITGTVISSDTTQTRAMVLGDLDGDGDLDLVTGNDAQPNRLYLNNGSEDPFAGITYTLITTATHHTWALAIGDVDRDGDLDLITGNDGELNQLYLNNGTAEPFSGVAGQPISDDAHPTVGVALGDVNADGDLDLVAGNDDVKQGQPAVYNMLYLNQGDSTGPPSGSPPYYPGPTQAVSLRVDAESISIRRATLTPTATLPVNTSVSYYLSNNGGVRWFQVRSGLPFSFPTTGTDLRWRATLHSLSPALTPRVDEITITRNDWVYMFPIIFANAAAGS